MIIAVSPLAELSLSASAPEERRKKMPSKRTILARADKRLTAEPR